MIVLLVVIIAVLASVGAVFTAVTPSLHTEFDNEQRKLEYEILHQLLKEDEKDEVNCSNYNRS